MKIRDIFGESTEVDFHDKAQQNKKKRFQREKQWNDTEPKDNTPPLPVDRRTADEKKYDDVMKELRQKGYLNFYTSR